jgi:hypothetical protein
MSFLHACAAEGMGGCGGSFSCLFQKWCNDYKLKFLLPTIPITSCLILLLPVPSLCSPEFVVPNLEIQVLANPEYLPPPPRVDMDGMNGVWGRLRLYQVEIVGSWGILLP